MNGWSSRSPEGLSMEGDVDPGLQLLEREVQGVDDRIAHHPDGRVPDVLGEQCVAGVGVGQVEIVTAAVIPITSSG
jgi:hypothetical protein